MSTPYYCHLGCYDHSVFLVFPKSWVGTRLPQAPHKRYDFNWLTPDLVVTLLDTQDGKEYKARFWQHYESMTADDEAHVQCYMVDDHYCPCHRKADAQAAGAETDEECEGNRFLVKSLCPKAWPKLVLFSETMTVEELEATLTEGLNTPA